MYSRLLVLFLVVFVSRFNFSFADLPFLKEFDFSNSDHGWVGDFSDYPIGEESFFELDWGWETLPVEIKISGKEIKKGLFLSGNNHSDDLFMFAKRKVPGLEPNTLYHLQLDVWIESNIPSGLSIGIGGSPGKSVFFKVGASREEPKKVPRNNYYLMNVDKGNQSIGGKNAIVVGDLENLSPDPYDSTYFPKWLKTEVPLQVQSDPQGCIWIFLGTDSGFEGATKFYIAKVTLQGSVCP